MSAFKDAVANDIKSVFINVLEFADRHNINGEMVDAVIDTDVLKERQPPTASEYAEGIFKDEKLVYVKHDELRRKPVKGEILRLDGDIYLVEEVAENMGVLEITISANEQ